MSVPHLLFALVLLKVPEYVRDILTLPLFGSRILYIDFYLLCAGCLLCACVPPPSQASPARPARTSTGALLLVFAALACITYLIHMVREEEDRFFALQIGTFLLAIYQLHLLMTRWPVEWLLRYLRTGLVLIFIAQLLLHAARLADLGVSPDWLTRNQLAYTALIGWAVSGYVGARRLRLHFALLALGLMIANSTRGAVVLVLLILPIHWLDRRLPDRSTLRAIGAAVVPLFVLLIPVLALRGMLFYFDASIEDVLGLDEYRIFINDNYTSLISRNISVTQTVIETINNGQWLGLGVDRSARMLFLGYPVHNYIASSIAVFGIVGVGVSAALVCFLIAVSARRLAFGAMGAYLLIVANDLFAVMALLFIPLLTAPARPRGAAGKPRGSDLAEPAQPPAVPWT